MTYRLLAIGALLCAAACASAPKSHEVVQPREPRWAANGWLTPDRSVESEIIGLYVERAECEAALADWLASQVVGNPIHGECLPIDTH